MARWQRMNSVSLADYWFGFPVFGGYQSAAARTVPAVAIPMAANSLCSLWALRSRCTTRLDNTMRPKAATQDAMVIPKNSAPHISVPPRRIHVDAYCDLLRIAGPVQNAALVLMTVGGVFGFLALRRGNRQAAALLAGVLFLPSAADLLVCR